MDFQLEARMNDLPFKVVQDIRDSYMGLPKSSRKRWRMLLTDEAYDMLVTEAFCWMKNVGCSLEELVNPEISLASIYQKRKKEVEQKAKAEFYKMS